jgi:hypothetical protein
VQSAEIAYTPPAQDKIISELQKQENKITRENELFMVRENKHKGRREQRSICTACKKALERLLKIIHLPFIQLFIF